MNAHPDTVSTATGPQLAVGWTQRWAAALARPLARRFFALEVRGLKHLPVAGACVLAANHTSHVDTLALATATGRLSQRLVFLAARDYFTRNRLHAWFLRRLICLVGFERGAGLAAAKHNLALLAACRDAGRIIVLFPEGTRSPDGRMREFKPGVAMFADKLGLPVVPCRIEGAHAALPKGKNWPRRSRLRLTFGAALHVPAAANGETAAERSERYARFAAELQETITQLGGDATVRARQLQPA